MAHLSILARSFGRALRVSALVLLFAVPGGALHAAEMLADTQNFSKARVVRVVEESERAVPGTALETTFQHIEAEFLEGPEKGSVVAIRNDYLALEPGEVFYVMVTTSGLDGSVAYAVSEPYRLPALAAFFGLFVAAVAFFGGKQGLRGLLSLSLGLFAIAFAFLPSILAGFSPVLASLLVAALIVTLGSYITHGFRRTTSAAVVGMIATICFTGVLAWAAVAFGRLSGFYTDEAVYLNFNTGGTIDFAGLLLGAMLIGLLGVLYDMAIGQAVAVEELARAGSDLSPRELYARALRIGREHVGALVNTLAIAYVGTALPMLLLFSTSDAPLLVTLNREDFATEFLRIIVGSIGIVLAVPISTWAAVWMLRAKPAKE